MLANLLGSGATRPDQLAEPVEIDTSHLRMTKSYVTGDIARSVENNRGADKRLLKI